MNHLCDLADLASIPHNGLQATADIRSTEGGRLPSLKSPQLLQDVVGDVVSRSLREDVKRCLQSADRRLSFNYGTPRAYPKNAYRCESVLIASVWAAAARFP
jgi:hypothetical protein